MRFQNEPYWRTFLPGCRIHPSFLEINDNQQKITENSDETLVFSLLSENVVREEQEVMVAKSPGIEYSVLESLRATLKEEITSQIRGVLIESQNELLKMLKPISKGNETKENEQNQEKELEVPIHPKSQPEASELKTKTRTLVKTCAISYQNNQK